MTGATLLFNPQETFAEISTVEITAENLSAAEKEIYERDFLSRRLTIKFLPE